MEVAINNNIYKQASDYAKEQGLNLSSVIEDFLKRFIVRSKAANEQDIPDVVKSLLGAAENIDNEDLMYWDVAIRFTKKQYNSSLWHTTNKCN